MISPNNDSNQDAQHEFWERIESVHGTVKAKSMVVYMEHTEKKKSFFRRAAFIERWGLLYTTVKGVYFYFFPKRNMFSQLFSPKEESQFFFELLWNDIISYSPPLNLSFVKRLLGKGIETLSLISKAHIVRYESLLIAQHAQKSTNSKISESPESPESPKSPKTNFNTHEQETPTEFKFRLDFNQNQILSSLREFIPQKEHRGAAL